jgi:protein TonB
MNFANSYNDTPRNLVGIVTVAVLHLVVGYFLLTGLGRKVIEVIKKPLEVNIIEETKKIESTPPPPKPVQAVHKLTVPPPAYVPPPEVQVQAPTAPAISVTSQTPPPAAPAAPAIVNVGAVCPNHLEARSRIQYPPQALRLGLTGEVLVEFTVQPSGAVADIAVVQSTNKVFNAAAAASVALLRCVGQSQPVRVQVPFAFELKK